MSEERPLIVGFLKIYNELLKGNLPRVLDNLSRYCDQIFVCDDGSTDDTPYYLKWWRGQNPDIPLHVLRFENNDLIRELERKQVLLEMAGQVKPHWIFWLDGDEVLDAKGTAEIRGFAEEALSRPERSWRFKEMNLWMSTRWYRVDSGFDEGSFVRLWRWSPELSMADMVGTHHPQFPVLLFDQPMGITPFHVLHYGNASLQHLKWKAIQYWGGLGGVDRHLRFAQAQYEPVPLRLFPPGCDPGPHEPPPGWLSEGRVETILRLRNLKSLPETFAIVLPTYQRASTLSRAIDSVLAQIYEQWLLFVLDDGSADQTPEVVRPYLKRDPRVFYCRYPENRGGVVMNEVGMTLACETAEWWARLGSDDWWLPGKLLHDTEALRAGAKAVYGPFQVHREEGLAEVCSPYVPPETIREELRQGKFHASWANVAVATSVLDEVRKRWGNFCDPRLRNMEDFLVNRRIVDFADFVWREGVDGIWNVDPQGASGQAHSHILTRDEQLTREILEEMKHENHV